MLDLILCDVKVEMIRAWEEAFAECSLVEVRHGDFADVAADAYVSPANSFGAMDGGIDLILRERFGMQIEDRVQEAIGRLGGKLPVGLALIVETGDDEVPYLIVAPTMEIPMSVAGTNHAYLGMRAILTTAVKFAGRNPGRLQSVAIPGLCTGIGGMDARVAAEQMRLACADVLGE